MSHSDIVGGSTAKRVMACPASVKLCQSMPPKAPTKYTREGTLLHNVISEVLDKGVPATEFIGTEYEGVVLTEELFDRKLSVALELLEQVDPDGRMEFATEVRVGFGDLIPDVFGSTDLLGRIDNRAIMLDWKFGDGVPVDAEENPQLLFYTAAAMRTPECRWAFEGVEEIECFIIQPPSIKRWKTTPGRVLAFERELILAVKEALGNNPRFAMGDHCRWCSAKPICPAMTGAVDRALHTKLDLLNGGEIGQWLTQADVLESWIKDLRELAQTMMENEKLVPGWKLVRKRATRQWADEEGAREALEGLGLDAAELMETSLISPAKADKVLKKHKLTMPDDLVVSVSTGTTLAPLDDPRPEAVLIGKHLNAALGQLGVK